MNLSNSRVTVPNDDDFKMAVAQNQEDDETSFSSLGSDLIEEMGKKDRKNSFWGWGQNNKTRVARASEKFISRKMSYF